MALNCRKADRLRKIFNGCEITMETFGTRVVCPRLPRVPAHLDGIFRFIFFSLSSARWKYMAGM